MKAASRLPWPVDGTGEKEKAKFLCKMRENDMAVEIRLNMLESCGIPCFCRYPGDGSFGKVVLGMSGEGAEIYVPESLLEDAKLLCEPVDDEA